MQLDCRAEHVNLRSNNPQDAHTYPNSSTATLEHAAGTPVLQPGLLAGCALVDLQMMFLLLARPLGHQ